MRLSEWRKAAPTRDAMSAKVIAVLKPVLADMGTDADPECWVAWGDDPAFRYSILAPTLAGLVTVAIRISNPEEGPRATAKLIRWSKLSISELGIEAAGGHRLVAVQVESLVLKGMDEEAGLISEFVRGLIASVDNRAPQVIPVAVVQAAGLRAGTAEPIAAVQSTPPAAAAPKPKPRPKAPPKAAALKPLHVVPAARKPAAAAASPASPAAPAAPRTAAKEAKTVGPKGVPASAASSASTPDAAAAPAPKPIAARAASRRPGSLPLPQTAPSDASKEGQAGLMRIEPEPEPDRSEWIGPHPIEQAPAREPGKPRPWTP
jgi:hypothetical protein